MSVLFRDADLIVQYFGPKSQPPGELAPWVDLFLAWRDRLHHYRAVSKGDIGWDYLERSQVGFLAAAAWHIGGAAIEEYPIEKKDPADRRRKYDGRADLWLGFGGRGFALEAKYANTRLDTRGTRATLIQAFDKAGMDSLSCTENVHYTGGVAFVPLYLPVGTPPRKRAAYLEEHINDAVDDGADSLREQVREMYDYVFRVDLVAHHTREADDHEPVGVTLLVGLDG
jgi:hypothetical protein